MAFLFGCPGIGQTGLWPKQTEPANGPAIGLSGRTFQLSANRQDVSTELGTLVKNLPPYEE